MRMRKISKMLVAKKLQKKKEQDCVYLKLKNTEFKEISFHLNKAENRLVYVNDSENFTLQFNKESN